MPIEVTNQGGVSHISIDDEMTIYTAAILKNELVDHLNQSEELEVSLHGVSEMDSAGLQLMLLLHQEALRSKKTLRFVQHSPAVVDILETLNLAAYFGDPIVLLAGER